MVIPDGEVAPYSPTFQQNTEVYYYYLIYQFIMLLVVCWIQNFLLGSVGITSADFSNCVGTEKRTNGLLDNDDINFTTHSQRLNDFYTPLLDCCAVGTENDLHT